MCLCGSACSGHFEELKLTDGLGWVRTPRSGPDGMRVSRSSLRDPWRSIRNRFISFTVIGKAGNQSNGTLFKHFCLFVVFFCLAVAVGRAVDAAVLPSAGVASAHQDQSLAYWR